jgi:hypothetical protein
MANDLKTIFDKYKQDPSIVHKSQSWFMKQTAALQGVVINKNRLFREGKIVNKIIPGRLYMFYYDPKYKEELPHYDRFPLVFPYKFTPQDGMMGLNMHYLPYFQRVQLMDRLMMFSSNKNFDENTRIRYSWDLISGVAKFKFANSCIKHYLKEHIRSQFIEVPPSDWHTAMMLPVESFVGANKKQVWKESVRR